MLSGHRSMAAMMSARAPARSPSWSRALLRALYASGVAPSGRSSAAE